MNFVLVLANCFSVIFVVQHACSAERGSFCLTPNNETAVCTPAKFCKPIVDALLTRNLEAINFAKKSQCGYDYEPLVCCGSTGYPANREKYLQPFEHKLLPNKNVCGVERTDHRIFGGQRTDLDEFPWTVLLRYQDEFGDDAGFKCGGSLINQRYVMTAAHCVVLIASSGLNLNSVRLGEWRISTAPDCLGLKPFQECADPVLDVDVEEKIPHPSYRRREHLNDIALVRLKQNIRYTDFIRPICLPSPNSPPTLISTKMIVVGWGATEYSTSSDLKLKVQVPLISNQECIRRIQQKGNISENHICAGGVKGKDSCQGDSGGPLMRMVEDQSAVARWYQEGVISWGIGCGLEDFPGVYTKVVKYVNWIVNNMKA